jgi:lipid II:glycine glycyltransferase (peptidoglycan interpeptide bridge formation enzyme)
MKIPFTQTEEYLKWQESVGNETFYREFYGSDGKVEMVAAGVVLGTRVGRVLYFPFGPIISDSISPETQDEFINWVKTVAQENNCVFVRFECAEKKSFIQNFFSPHIKTYNKEGLWQPRLEWVLDLKGEKEQKENLIYEGFSKNCRYSIRRCEKEVELGNVRIEIVEEDFNKYLPDFLETMKETGVRNSFLNHDEKYFESVFNSLEQQKISGFLLVGKVKTETTHDKDNLMDVGQESEWVVNSMAVIILDMENKRANYVYGGSRNFKRELGVSYKVQWEAIKKAVELGCLVYNFGGITNGVFGKPSLQGVTNFKKQFGGYEQFNGYFYDMSIKKIKYIIYIVWKFLRN